MPLVWLGLIMAALFAVAYFAKAAAKRAQSQPPAPRTAAPQPAAGQNRGRPPHPAARIVDFPGGGMRLVDLRSLPRADLEVLRLGVVQQQLALERPIPAQIWIVDAEIARGWAAMSETARIIGLPRLCDPRAPKGRNFLYVHGGALEKAESDAIGAAGVEIVLSMTNFGAGSPTRELEDFLDPPEPWAATPNDRPVPGYTVVKSGPFNSFVHVLPPFAFVDLRRIAPAALANSSGLGQLEEALKSPALAEATHVVWCASPWLIEQLPASDLPRLEQLIASQAKKQQRLAIISPADEPLPDNATARSLKAKLSPISELFQWKTKDGRVFHVRPTDALHDVYFTEAWKQPRL